MNLNNTNPAFTVTSTSINLVNDGTKNLIGWSSVVICDAFRLNHIALRKNAAGKLYLSFPNKVTSNGQKVGYFFPISKEASEVIRTAILTRLVALAKAAEEDGTGGK